MDLILGLDGIRCGGFRSWRVRIPLMNLGWLVQLAVMGVQVAVLTLRSRFTVEANEQLQAEHEESLRRREGHLLSAINKAKENPEEHAAILAWDA